MAQSADGGGEPLGIGAFWPPNQAEPQLLWEHWIEIPLGNDGETRISLV